MNCGLNTEVRAIMESTKFSGTTAVALQAATGVQAKSALPNVVFLMADDQSTYTLGCYGNPPNHNAATVAPSVLKFSCCADFSLSCK
jgi:hypothetical protein